MQFKSRLLLISQDETLQVRFFIFKTQVELVKFFTWPNQKAVVFLIVQLEVHNPNLETSRLVLNRLKLKFCILHQKVFKPWPFSSFAFQKERKRNFHPNLHNQRPKLIKAETAKEKKEARTYKFMGCTLNLLWSIIIIGLLPMFCTQFYNMQLYMLIYGSLDQY